MLRGALLASPLLIFFLCCDPVLHAIKQFFNLKMTVCPRPGAAEDCALVPRSCRAGLCASGHSPCLSLQQHSWNLSPTHICSPRSSLSSKPCYVNPGARGRSVTGDTPALLPTRALRCPKQRIDAMTVSEMPHKWEN